MLGRRREDRRESLRGKDGVCVRGCEGDIGKRGGDREMLCVVVRCGMRGRRRDGGGGGDER